MPDTVINSGYTKQDRFGSVVNYKQTKIADF